MGIKSVPALLLYQEEKLIATETGFMSADKVLKFYGGA
jgi:hypothetical protein